VEVEPLRLVAVWTRKQVDAMGIYDPNAELIIRQEHEIQTLQRQLDAALEYVLVLEQSEEYLKNTLIDLEAEVIDLKNDNKRLERESSLLSAQLDRLAELEAEEDI
jgi:hypothetical protein